MTIEQTWSLVLVSSSEVGEPRASHRATSTVVTVGEQRSTTLSKAKLVGSSILPLLALFGPTPAGAAPVTPTPLNPGFEQGAPGTASPAGWTSRGSTNADYPEAGGHSGGFR